MDCKSIHSTWMWRAGNKSKFVFSFKKYKNPNFQSCHIWIQHGKFILLSTNKNNFGQVILELIPNQILSCEFKEVVTDILGKIEFSVDFRNIGKNTQFKI